MNFSVNDEYCKTNTLLMGSTDIFVQLDGKYIPQKKIRYVITPFFINV